ncbi:hypothetical protein GCM10020219_045910 [Nonomuraea dietziae]
MLAMTADEAHELFGLEGLATLGELGLGYLTLGQAAHTRCRAVSGSG